eukprot:gene9585-12909_t
MGNASAIVEGYEENDLLIPDTLLKSKISSPLVSKSLLKVSNMLMNDESARKCYIDFINRGDWVNQLSNADPFARKIRKLLVKDNISRINSESSNEDDNFDQSNDLSTVQETINSIYEEYGLPQNFESQLKFHAITEKKLLALTTEGIVVQNSNNDEDNNSLFSAVQMKPILLSIIFPIFIRSQQYSEWLRQQEQMIVRGSYDINEVILKHRKRNSFESSSSDISTKISIGTPSSRLQELFDEYNDNHTNELNTENQPKSTVIILDLIHKNLSSILNAEHAINQMLINTDWLVSIIETVENLPLCVSIASADINNPGFPLIYVNKQFEITTQYSRHEIIGKNCKFLQSNNSEIDQINKMRHALANAQPIKVAITNKKKNNSEFLNLFALKPVFDRVKPSVQYDLSNAEIDLKLINLVDDLLAILPNIMK